MERHFGKHTNINESIMVIPQEEGTDESDHYMASIGDATMNHIQGLDDSERQLWEELIHIPRIGKIFRAEPNLNGLERDPRGLRWRNLEEYAEELHRRRFETEDQTKEQLLDKANKYLPTRLSQHEYEELIVELGEEHQRREEAEEDDKLGAVELISFHDWEKAPGLWKHIDLPSTPPDRLCFMGNTGTQFMDVFPEGHPDESVIQSMLQILNRDWELCIDEEYAEFAANWVKAHAVGYTPPTWIDEWGNEREGMAPQHPTFKLEETETILLSLVKELLEDEEEEKGNEIVTTHLTQLDDSWVSDYRRITRQKHRHVWDPTVLVIKGASVSYGSFVEHTNKPNAVTHMLRQLEKQWMEQTAKGFIVYPEVMRTGSMLWKKHRKGMNAANWKHYRAMKRFFAPRVLLNGVDLNRDQVQSIAKAFFPDRLALSAEIPEYETKEEEAIAERELQARFAAAHKGAIKLWDLRQKSTITSLADAYNRGLIPVQSLASDEQTMKIVTFLETRAKTAIETGDARSYHHLSGYLVKSQKSGTKVQLSEEQWRQIWVCYRILRDSVVVASIAEDKNEPRL